MQILNYFLRRIKGNSFASFQLPYRQSSYPYAGTLKSLGSYSNSPYSNSVGSLGANSGLSGTSFGSYPPSSSNVMSYQPYSSSSNIASYPSLPSMYSNYGSNDPSSSDGYNSYGANGYEASIGYNTQSLGSVFPGYKHYRNKSF